MLRISDPLIEFMQLIDAAAIEKVALHDYPDNIVQKLLGHRQDDDGFKIRVRWLGFDRTHDTWEPVTKLAADVSDLVEKYLMPSAASAGVHDS